MPELPRIRLLALGGTISSVRLGSGSDVTPSLKAAQLVENVPELATVARVEVGDIATLASFEVTPATMLEVAREVHAAFADGCDGVVVTHGTDTIEETAYALALMVPRGRPVVLTGAMRNPTLLGPDGPANLMNAFTVAANRDAAGLGPLLMLNDEIHTARFAAKTHSTNPGTFASGAAGAVGEVVEGQSYVWLAPRWDDHLGLPESLARVDVQLVRLASGVDDTLLRAVLARGTDGVVLEGFGGGHAPGWLLEALDAVLGAGIPVVVASRCPRGRTLARTYRMPGAETDLLDRGVLMAGHLTGHKARLRLLVGLALGQPPAALFPVE